MTVGLLSPAAVIAAYLDLPEATIRWWAHKGHIRRRGTGHRGLALYDADEVRAYHWTRLQARRLAS